MLSNYAKYHQTIYIYIYISRDLMQESIRFLLEKYMFVSHIKHTQWKINGSILFAIDNMYYVSFRI